MALNNTNNVFNIYTGNEVILMQDSTKQINFIDRIKQSPDECEIINHFHKHPEACETVEDIANFLGKPPDEVENFVRDLEQWGILHNCGPIWGEPVYAGKYVEFYSLSRNEELKSIFIELHITSRVSNN